MLHFLKAFKKFLKTNQKTVLYSNEMPRNWQHAKSPQAQAFAENVEARARTVLTGAL